MKKILILSFLTFLFIINQSFAANVANGVSNAKIVAPISITAVNPLEFGSLAQNASGYTVAITAASSPTITPSIANMLISGVGNSRTAASFTVTGETAANFSITTSSTATLSDGAAHTMTVDTFTTSSTTGGIVDGSTTIYVGGTLHVDAAQVAGTYNTGSPGGSPFTVTVNYN